MTGSITKLSVAVLTLIGLAACASSTAYKPAGEDGQYGFTEQRIESDRFRITFRGNSLTNRETVETYLLVRAAEVTVESGYDYFVVIDEDTERKTTYTREYDYPPRWAYYGRGRPFPYYGYGYGWGPRFRDDVITERNRYTAMAYITLGRGQKPVNSPAAYNAREVIENLAPLVKRPETE